MVNILGQFGFCDDDCCPSPSFDDCLFCGEDDVPAPKCFQIVIAGSNQRTSQGGLINGTYYVTGPFISNLYAIEGGS